jgi:hypothetical protein
VSATRTVLAEMRGSEHDAAQTDEAKAKRLAPHKRRKEVARAWEQENPGPYDAQVYRTEIQPRLADVTLPQMMRATGLTSGLLLEDPARREGPSPDVLGVPERVGNRGGRKSNAWLIDGPHALIIPAAPGVTIADLRSSPRRKMIALRLRHRRAVAPAEQRVQTSDMRYCGGGATSAG